MIYRSLHVYMYNCNVPLNDVHHELMFTIHHSTLCNVTLVDIDIIYNL